MLSVEESGTIWNMGIAVQKRINDLKKEEAELTKIISRIVRLQGGKITDDDGDNLTDAQIKAKYSKTLSEFKKCMPEIDLTKPQTPMES